MHPTTRFTPKYPWSYERLITCFVYQTDISDTSARSSAKLFESKSVKLKKQLTMLCTLNASFEKGLTSFTWPDAIVISRRVVAADCTEVGIPLWTWTSNRAGTTAPTNLSFQCLSGGKENIHCKRASRGKEIFLDWGGGKNPAWRLPSRVHDKYIPGNLIKQNLVTMIYKETHCWKWLMSESG